MHLHDIEEMKNRLEREIVAYCVLNPRTPQKDIALLFGVATGTVSTLCTRQGIRRQVGRPKKAL